MRIRVPVSTSQFTPSIGVRLKSRSSIWSVPTATSRYTDPQIVSTASGITASRTAAVTESVVPFQTSSGSPATSCCHKPCIISVCNSSDGTWLESFALAAICACASAPMICVSWGCRVFHSVSSTALGFSISG